MKKIQIHSLEDWDYVDGAHLELSPVAYVSPPTSLRTVPTAPNPDWEHIFLGEALGACIPAGRIITWWRYSQVYVDILFHFRTQDIPVNGYPDNGYFIQFNRLGSFGFRRVAAVDTQLWSEVHGYTLGPNIWHHVRVTWYPWVDEYFVTQFRIMLDLEVAGEWVNIKTFDDPENAFADSAVNRCGFVFYSWDPGYWHHLDDTEIWRKT